MKNEILIHFSFKKMELLNNICLDISFYDDRVKIIRKYLLPKILEEKSFANINVSLLNDVFNCLNIEEIIILEKEIEKIIGTFDKDTFTQTDYNIGLCHNCKIVSPLIKCKREHDEDCEYSEITSPEGCLQLFCDNCIFHICAHTNECRAVRCEACSSI